MKTNPIRKHAMLLLWFALLLAAVPLMHVATRVQPAGPLPEHWKLPASIGAWQGDTIYYSTDPNVHQAFTRRDLAEAGLCPVSGAEVDTISPAERRLLPDDVDIMRKRYRHEDGRERMVILLISGSSREGIHRPDWCLAAQGFRAGDRRVLSARTADGDSFGFGVYPILGAAGDALPGGYFVYWFEGPNQRTPYNAERILRMGWDRIRHGRIQRWAYVSIQLSLPGLAADSVDEHLQDIVQWLANGMMGDI